MLNELEWIELKNKFFCTETEAETAPLVAPSGPYAEAAWLAGWIPNQSKGSKGSTTLAEHVLGCPTNSLPASTGPHLPSWPDNVQTGRLLNPDEEIGGHEDSLIHGFQKWC